MFSCFVFHNPNISQGSQTMSYWWVHKAAIVTGLSKTIYIYFTSLKH